MKTTGHRLFVSALLIILLVIGIVGFVLISAGIGAYCAIGLGCSGPTIIRLYAETIGSAWPLILIFLLPFAIFGGAAFLSLKEEKNEQ